MQEKSKAADGGGDRGQDRVMSGAESVKGQVGAAQVREYEDKRTNKSTGSFNPENFRTFDLEDGGTLISRHNPLKEADLKKAEGVKSPEVTKAGDSAKPGDKLNNHNSSILKVEPFPGVSKEYLHRVEAVRDRFPPGLQKAAESAGVKIYVYKDAEQLPQVLKDQQARRHKQEETTGHLPAFYEPSAKVLVFIENPRLTGSEQKLKDDFTNGQDARSKAGVQSYGDAAKIDPKAQSYAPIERIGSHEFGHAVEQALLGHFSSSPEFDQAFKVGNERVRVSKARGLEDLNYFDKPQLVGKTLDYRAAKQELFAEMFCISLKRADQYDRRDRLLLEHFSEVRALVAKKVKEVSH